MHKFIVKFLETNESREYLLHPYQTILNLKEKISVDFLHSVGSIVLQCGSGYLEDHQVLNSLGIFNNEVLLTIRDLLSVYIKTKFMTFHLINNHEFKMSRNDTVNMLKLKISKLIEFSPEIIGLKFENNILKDTKTFSDYKITDNECVLFGLNVYFLEINGISHSKYKVINKFIEEDTTVSDLLSQYCIEENIDFENVRCEYENKPLSDENIVDVMKHSLQPTLELKFRVKVILIDKNENHCEIFMFANETIADLRNKLNKVLLEKLNENQVLLIDNICLENENSLKFYGPKDVYEVYCGFLLHIITDEIDNFNPSFFVHSKMRVFDIKRILSNNHSVEYNLINLTLGEIQLEDTRCIDFYAIDECSELVMSFGLSILIWAIDEPIEYIVKDHTRVEDIRKYVAFRKRLSNPATVTLLVDQNKLDDSDNLLGLARDRHDLIVTAEHSSVMVEIELEDPNLPLLLVDTWRSMTIGQLKQAICANYRTARRDSIRLWWVGDQYCTRELINDNETVEESQRIANSADNQWNGGRLRLTLQDRVTFVDEAGTAHSVVIWPHDTVSSLKQLVSLKLRIKLLSDIHLFHDGQPLENDSRSILSYGVDRTSVLEVKLGKPILVSGDAEFKFLVSRDSTVAEIKSKLLGLLFKPTMSATDYRLELTTDNRELLDAEHVRDLNLTSIQYRVVGTRLITVYVCNLTGYGGGRFVMDTVEVMSIDTVGSVKMRILQTHCPDCTDRNSVGLAILGNLLSDQTRLNECNISNYDVLILKVLCSWTGFSGRPDSYSNTVHVTVKLNGHNQPISENLSDYSLDSRQSVEYFKQRLSDESNISLDSVPHMYHDSVMGDHQSFCNYDFESNSLLVQKTAEHDEAHLTPKTKIRICVQDLLLPVLEKGGRALPDRDVEIDVGATVTLLKAAIERTWPIGSQMRQFVLVCNGSEIMEEHRCLDSYGLVSGSKVALCHSVLVQHQHEFQVTEHSDQVNFWRVPVLRSDRVLDLQARVASRLGIEPHHVSLYYWDSVLNPHTLLEDARIYNDCLITMFVTDSWRD